MKKIHSIGIEAVERIIGIRRRKNQAGPRRQLASQIEPAMRIQFYIEKYHIRMGGINEFHAFHRRSKCRELYAAMASAVFFYYAQCNRFIIDSYTL